MSDVVLITVTGVDRPGITSRLTEVLAQHEVRLLDIGQAVIHESLNLGFLVELMPTTVSATVFKDVLFAAHEMGLTPRFQPVTGDEYEKWVAVQGTPRLIVTLFGPEIRADHLNRITQVIAKHDLNIAVITRLSGRISLANPPKYPRACVELSVRGELKDPSALRLEFLNLAPELSIDIALQADDVYRRNRRMICFDMDSTLIQTEVIDELAARAGVKEEVSQITEAAMRGELDFQQSLRRRLSLLKGLDASVMEDIAQNLPISPGAQRLIKTVKQLGYKTAILSGGFNYFGYHLQKLLGVDYVHANELEIKDGKLTGNVIGEIVDGQCKARLLREIAERENIRLEQTVAVGDGANDLPMLDIAGLGIAYHAKPKVKQSAEQAIDTLGLDGVLYLLGMRDREVPFHE